MTVLDRWRFRAALVWSAPGWSPRARFIRHLLRGVVAAAEEYVDVDLSLNEAVTLTRTFGQWLVTVEPDLALAHPTRAIWLYLTTVWRPEARR